MGFWTKTNENKIETEDYNRFETIYLDIGAFVTGGDLFNGNMPIEGRASYQGWGVVYAYENVSTYISTVDKNTGKQTNNYGISSGFVDSSLSVDFSSGIISGRLSNIKGGTVEENTLIDYSSISPKNVSGELILNNAKIGNSHSGFFEGNLTGTLDGRTYKGLYGGQFYGNNESDGKPGTVAGTLGGLSSDGRFTLMGYWMGDK